MMTLAQQLDHMRKLSAQGGLTGARVVYAASGVLPAAVVVTDPDVVVEHAAYLASIRSPQEGHYLTAIINRGTARECVAAMQAKGQGGARHFDNLIWELKTPEFAPKSELHKKIAIQGELSQSIAAELPIVAEAHFTSHRRTIRDALASHGVARRTDALVMELLGSG